MSEEKMPAAEANSYELAFHVLPTVAEGEVPAVFQDLKDIITKAGGEITIEEAPARFDLAYEIVQYLEGRNRKFTSAYFGWVRFTAQPESIEAVNEGIEGVKELLRHLLIKLTKVEEENPFYFHEALAEDKVTNVDLDEEPAEAKPEAAEETPAEEEEKEEAPAEEAEATDADAGEEEKK